MPAVTAQRSLSSAVLLQGCALLAALAFMLASTFAVHADEKTIRIGYQKYGTLVLLKGRASLEPKLKALGYDVVWSEFPSGPPLLEALNAGAIDFGTAGETPPIFAQAAGDALTYVAHEPPAPRGEAILVPKASTLQTVADLRGKKVALNKGSNVHYLLVRALERAGLSLADITPVYLAPADARAAFERGAVDAWVIWDPYLAAAEVSTSARTLADGSGLVPNHQFYFATRSFAAKSGSVLDTVIAAIGEVDSWAKDNTDAVARELAPSVGIPAPVLAVALKRQGYGVRPLDEPVIAEQQRIADTFHGLGLIPKALTVTDAVRKPGT
ncbi:sulfonate ABC transporter substrate-binding protein [Methylobacterium gnaphalii]|uniref:Putative aliphatic sulfonates-binding protein n=1 Tax=Methylobacterium gnaphalii TaxID=1010610 RepID=A0A512JJR8_9HYPH|nr:sulfonate ABC transporter substrate-binding protein [Methylobacterium gnaphalii]GEP10194.1 sulfonate ABC transporter substrate-binding protein [Methylobacterium gnaphalii]GJD70239.1 Putative aliphatic sulfonates-binding protein [Methylobacterium gnaphalii]GLS48711.1 sulfonate ABC transporter substrate-binding protein [Methylobacterium gnaphalii]